ncbi:hypothetical protein GRF59_01895 [Paenibacillus sp. HJL G12]|uniref:Uncharacterized protein n=1 Tax=Paenibacillus dendrobii TaxID=2691084 RepID=A0A7X3IF67_9BACL|nr:hypothetical protein [Paenibacillus dendrobii]MWV42371.1 hypothetical protein [Paenibacillus dendrobii]
MKNSNYRKLLTMTAAVSVLSMMLATGAGAESIAADDIVSTSSAVNEPGALTPPPPQEFNTLSITGNFKYLAAGGAYISAVGNGQLSVNADTRASSPVDTIKAYVTLQRYTGTSWVDVSSTTFTNSSSDYVFGDAMFTGVKGFYYRVACTHSINKGGLYEQSIEYSGMVLAY